MTQISQIEINAAHRNFIGVICDICGLLALASLTVNVDGSQSGLIAQTSRAQMIAQTNIPKADLIDQSVRQPHFQRQNTVVKFTPMTQSCGNYVPVCVEVHTLP